MSAISGVTAVATAALKQEVGIAVLAKAKDQSEQQGQELVRMMQQSVQPHLGGNVDLSV
ncbi:YjfB family protein [Cohnella nanjingensis]|uniref:YjfB family protein n=1 Tax=Cohnella nanjingensis TaxID=1387779 RepID=A0A7X0VFE6_9BACL|nr:YjfB family protein [Cohnella nanjingensis]MBB6671741.1 YjfB family protein [Cohnella nanjingensis]